MRVLGCSAVEGHSVLDPGPGLAPGITTGDRWPLAQPRQALGNRPYRVVPQRHAKSLRHRKKGDRQSIQVAAGSAVIPVIEGLMQNIGLKPCSSSVNISLKVECCLAGFGVGLFRMLADALLHQPARNDDEHDGRNGDNDEGRHSSPDFRIFSARDKH